MKKNQKRKAQKEPTILKGLALKNFFRMLRFTIFSFFLGLMQLLASGTYSQTTKLSLEINNERLESVLESIEDESEFFFLYNKDLIDVEQKVNINVKNETIKSLLNDLLQETNIVYVVYDRQIVLTNTDLMLGMVAQQKAIEGTATIMNAPIK